VLVLVLVAAGLGDVPRLVPFGPVTLGAVYSVLLALIISGGLLLCRSYPRRLLLRLVPWLVFLLWIALQSVWSPPSSYGIQHIQVYIQNILVYSLFGLCLLIGGLLAARNPERTVHLIDWAVRWMSRLALALVGLSLLTRGLTEIWLITQRTVAVVGLVPLSWYLMRLYFGVPHSWTPIVMWLGVLVLGSSRTASATAILLLTLVTLLKVWRQRTGALAAVSLVLFAAGGTAFLFLRVPHYRDRLFTGDTGYISVGDVGINASGRIAMWKALAKSGRESPVFGKGVGSSGFFALDVSEGTMGHPHNDYMRMWYDLGFVGLGLFLWALVAWGAILARGWYRASIRERPAAYTELAGLLALLSLMLVMVTDNAIVYAGTMAAMGILIGAGLGTAAHRRASGPAWIHPEERHRALASARNPRGSSAALDSGYA
jgi:O-antigen ligase